MSSGRRPHFSSGQREGLVFWSLTKLSVATIAWPSDGQINHLPKFGTPGGDSYEQSDCRIFATKRWHVIVRWLLLGQEVFLVPSLARKCTSVVQRQSSDKCSAVRPYPSSSCLHESHQAVYGPCICHAQLKRLQSRTRAQQAIKRVDRVEHSNT